MYIHGPMQFKSVLFRSEPHIKGLGSALLPDLTISMFQLDYLN